MEYNPLLPDYTPCKIIADIISKYTRNICYLIQSDQSDVHRCHVPINSLFYAWMLIQSAVCSCQFYVYQ